MATEQDAAGCCATVYDHPAVRWLIGESLHPGGLELTGEVARRMGLGPGMRVLDAGCGLGASAVHLAKSLGCRVVGVSLERRGIEAARARASREGVAHLTDFICGDLMEVALDPGGLDAALMECVLSIVEDKEGVGRRVAGALRPGGRLGLTDVTVDGPLPNGLRNAFAVAGCVGGAGSLEAYGRLLALAGLEIEEVRNLPDVARRFLLDLKGKLLVAEMAAKLGKLPVDVALIENGKRLLGEVRRLVDAGSLGYGLVVARRPL